MLPLYKCHKRVRAGKITEIVDDPVVPGGKILNLYKDGCTRNVDSAWLTRNPSVEIGGYFVEYQDGYTAFSPAKAFDEGYTKSECGYKDICFLKQDCIGCFYNTTMQG